jgi:hypothetical protein
MGLDPEPVNIAWGARRAKAGAGSTGWILHQRTPHFGCDEGFSFLLFFSGFAPGHDTSKQVPITSFCV